MILGIGSDIVNIARIEALLARFGERFENKTFTKPEQQQARSKGTGHSQQSTAARYAKYFAAKEACIKALGGSNGQGFNWHDFEVGYNENGKPTLRLSGPALARLNGQVVTIHLSLSDDYPQALAFVVIEKTT